VNNVMNINYQPSPLQRYDPDLQARAAGLADAVASRLGRRRVLVEKGSYSLLSQQGGVAAKIIIYEARQKPWELANGIYLLWAVEDGYAGPTIAIAPRWSRYSYVELTVNSSLDEAAGLLVRQLGVDSVSTDPVSQVCVPEMNSPSFCSGIAGWVTHFVIRVRSAVRGVLRSLTTRDDRHY
jgi:hypothetical protein